MTTPTGAGPTVSPLGTLADGAVGSGDAHGLVRLDRAGIEIDWWIGADDDWKFPSEGAVHTVRPGIAPAIESRVRVPGGEVVLRAYAIAAADAPLVVLDLENASPAAAVIAWVVRAAPDYLIGRVAIDGSMLLVDERARVELPRPPSRWAVETRSVGVRAAVIEGRAASGAFEPVTKRRGDLEVALLFPVAHRTRTRVAVAVATDASDGVALAQRPALADVERGWDTALDRGLRVELPDESLQAAVDAARVTLLLGTVGPARRDRVVASAAAAWGLTDGRLARGDVAAAADWPRVKADAAGAGRSARGAAEWLVALRDVLVRVSSDSIDMLPQLPDEWLGQSVAVHEMPTRNGPVSFALRWHGPRPALLWDVPRGSRVRAPGLDPTWESASATGETLLGEIDSTRLLHLRTATGVDAGVVVDDPGSFL